MRIVLILWDLNENGLRLSFGIGIENSVSLLRGGVIVVNIRPFFSKSVTPRSDRNHAILVFVLLESITSFYKTARISYYNTNYLVICHEFVRVSFQRPMFIHRRSLITKKVLPSSSLP
mmetsp:Transcript_26073/g.55358  ORF Transcript_26073/g.55358 Transcript_26073/m.55358 type:complete len:118 (+) Transcript_26073:157-510(+)